MKRADTTSRRSSLWVGLLSGPIAWTLHETVGYALVKPACSIGALPLEYVITLLALAAVGGGTYLSVRARSTGPTPDFLANAALLLNVLFAFAIVMEAIPNVAVNPCL